MRILSRLLATLPRTNEARSGVLGGSLALGIVLAAAPAAAQPAPAGAAAPGATAPGGPATAAQPPSDQPLIPPGRDGEPRGGSPNPSGAAAPAAGPAASAAKPLPPDPDRDSIALTKQGGQHPAVDTDGEVGARRSDVYAEDWWSSARPVFEIHGYYRVRSELFHNFALGRQDLGQNLWPQPSDNAFFPINSSGSPTSPVQVTLCGPDPQHPTPCSNNTQAGANMRFRVEPELHISDNLRIMAQIDLLDNLVLGSTPEGYYNTPSSSSTSGSGYQAAARGGYTPLGFFSTTQWAPVAGVNSTENSITVKRVWGEYMTPVGMLRFGRMPNQWGLGMVANAGDGYDSDWQSTVDRISFVTGWKRFDLYFSGMWDFAGSGQTSATFAQQQGQAYDLGQLDAVNQWGAAAVRRRNPELQRLDLAKGKAVVNGGAYVTYRNQFLANEESGTSSANSSASLGQSSANYTNGLVRRNAWMVTPDLWFQFLYQKFRFEAEGVMAYGEIAGIGDTPTSGPTGGYLNPYNASDNGYHIRQFGVATQSEFRAIEDKLRIQFGFGWASGDPGLTTLAPPAQGLEPHPVPTDRTYSEFAFHPDYRVDLILFRNILTRVEGAYYFRPSVEYDFVRDKNGQKLGGGAAVIWSRASSFIQTPGHASDLGVELDGKVYFQSRDGTLNDNHEKKGGFYTQLEYGVLFPLAGLGYLPAQQTAYTNPMNGATGSGASLSTATAQILRWYIGILY